VHDQDGPDDILLFLLIGNFGSHDVGVTAFHLEEEVKRPVLPGLRRFREHGEEHALRRFLKLDNRGFLFDASELLHVRLINR
jgi:hypothetical protein